MIIFAKKNLPARNASIFKTIIKFAIYLGLFEYNQAQL